MLTADFLFVCRCAMGICRNPDVAENIVQNTNWTVVRNPSSFFTSRFNAICSENAYCKCCKCTLREYSGKKNVHVCRATECIILDIRKLKTGEDASSQSFQKIEKDFIDILYSVVPVHEHHASAQFLHTLKYCREATFLQCRDAY